MIRPRLFTGTGAALALIAGAAPATAQWDPGTVAQGQVLGGMARGYAERGGYRDGSARSSSSRTARTCANVPRVRARLGASDPRVQELARLCRKAGY